MRKIIKYLWIPISIILWIIGLAGIPDDFNTWIKSLGIKVDLYEILNQDVFRWIYVISGFALVYFFSDTHQKMKQFIRKNPIKIENKKNEPGYYHNSSNIPATLEELFDEPPKINHVWQLCRISLHNSSKSKVVKKIKVKLTEIDQGGLQGKLPLHLHFQHDNVQPYKRSIDLNPGESQFVDVIQWEWDSGKSPYYRIVSIEDSVIAEVPVIDSDYKIKIEVTGENIPKASKYFYFNIKAKDNNDSWLWSAE